MTPKIKPETINLAKKELLSPEMRKFYSDSFKAVVAGGHINEANVLRVKALLTGPPAKPKTKPVV